MQASVENLKDVFAIDSSLNKIQDVDLLLERILFEARRVASAEAGSIYVKEANQLSIKYSQNDLIQKKLPAGQKLVFTIFSVDINHKTIAGYAADTKSIVNIADVYKLPSDSPYHFNCYFDDISGYKTTSNLTVPLVTSEGRLLGVIQMINKKDNNGNTIPFNHDDEMLVEHFATNATLALERAYMTRAIILRMIRLAELRDPKETGAHVNRVGSYSAEIYERYAFKKNIPEKEREHYKDILKLASMLHDVGKVAISDTILKKPAKFTPEEFAVMKTHTSAGASLFDDPQSELDHIAAAIAATHHENWDGTGYPGKVNHSTGLALAVDEKGEPQRLKGEEIPLWGRIVAVADVFDALISRRVYKEAWDLETVYAEIQKCAGNKFDPEVVEAFLEIKPHIEQIRTHYPDKN